MTRAAKWTAIIFLFPCILMISAGNVFGDLITLTEDDFPCETFPPKCPDIVTSFLTKLKQLIPDYTFSITTDERIYIDTEGKCTQLYIDERSTLKIRIKKVLAGEMYINRDPDDIYYNHLYEWVRLGNISIEDLDIKIRGNCGPGGVLPVFL